MEQSTARRSQDAQRMKDTAPLYFKARRLKARPLEDWGLWGYR